MLQKRRSTEHYDKAPLLPKSSQASEASKKLTISIIDAKSDKDKDKDKDKEIKPLFNIECAPDSTVLHLKNLISEELIRRGHSQSVRIQRLRIGRTLLKGGKLSSYGTFSNKNPISLHIEWCHQDPKSTGKIDAKPSQLEPLVNDFQAEQKIQAKHFAFNPKARTEDSKFESQAQIEDFGSEPEVKTRDSKHEVQTKDNSPKTMLPYHPVSVLPEEAKNHNLITSDHVPLLATIPLPPDFSHEKLPDKLPFEIPDRKENGIPQGIIIIKKEDISQSGQILDPLRHPKLWKLEKSINEIPFEDVRSSFIALLQAIIREKVNVDSPPYSIIIEHFTEHAKRFNSSAPPTEEDIYNLAQKLDAKLYSHPRLKPGIKAVICGILGALLGTVIGGAIGIAVTAWGGGFGGLATAVIGLSHGFALGMAIGAGAGFLPTTAASFFKYNKQSFELYKSEIDEEIASIAGPLEKAKQARNTHQLPK